MEKPDPRDTTTGLPRLRKQVERGEAVDPTANVPLDVLCAPLSAKHTSERTIASGQGFRGPNYEFRIKGRNW